MSKHIRDNLAMDMKTTVEQILATGITQADLAGRVPCSQALISAFLQGKRGQNVTYLIGSRLNELHTELVPEHQVVAQFSVTQTEQKEGA
jgi:transcriptional regulator with XRE-family HTH domain